MKVIKAKFQVCNKDTDKETTKILIVDEAENNVWISIADWTAQGMRNPADYVGGDITVEYYGVGEEIGDTGSIVETENSVKRSWSLSQNPIVLALASIEVAKQQLLQAQLMSQKAAKRLAEFKAKEALRLEALRLEAEALEAEAPAGKPAKALA